MAEAILTLSQALDRANAGQPIAPALSRIDAKVRASMGHAAITLARRAAIKATKRQLQARGLKVSHFAQREIVAQAETYFAAHREQLVAQAKADVERWRLQGFFGKRAQCAGLVSATQSAKG
jgi:hypothetical protein